MSAFIVGLVSIVIPAFNSSLTLPATIQSVLAQGYQDWEMIIVDDKSTDETLQIARSYAGANPRIRVFANLANLGAAATKAVAIRAARGQYIAYLDSDDLWAPNKLQVQLQIMQVHGLAFTFTSYTDFCERGDGVRHTAASSAGLHALLRRNVIGCLTVILDRARIPDIPAPELPYEDYATWLQLTRNGIIAFGIPQNLAHYRISKHSISSRKLRSAAWVWRIYREQERLSLLTSAYYFCHYVFEAGKQRCRLLGTGQTRNTAIDADV